MFYHFLEEKKISTNVKTFWLKVHQIKFMYKFQLLVKEKKPKITLKVSYTPAPFGSAWQLCPVQS